MSATDDVRRSVAQLNVDLLRWGLVVWTSGNVSARVPDKT